MKNSILSAPKAKIPLRGKKKKINSDFKSHSENLDSSPQISSITDCIFTTVLSDLEEVESNDPIVQNNSDQSDQFLDKEVVQGGRSCMEISTELPEVIVQPESQIGLEKWSENDFGERNLELELSRFTRTTEMLCGAITELSMVSIEQRKRRNGNNVVFFFIPMMLVEIMLAFFVGVMIAFIILFLIGNNLSDFNGVTPT